MNGPIPPFLCFLPAKIRTSVRICVSIIIQSEQNVNTPDTVTQKKIIFDFYVSFSFGQAYNRYMELSTFIPFREGYTTSYTSFPSP